MANLYFEATLDADQLKRELRDVNHRLDGFTKQAKQQGAEMDATFKRIGAAMAGYFSITAAKGFVDQMIQVRGEFQQLDIALTTMLGSKAEADKLMGEVVELAANTPFSLTELGQGAKRLLAFKEPADQVGDSLRRLGDLAAGASVPVTDLIQAYGKVSAKGKMQAEELNQFAERGIPIISELAKVVGATDKEIYKMAEQGKIGFPELQKAIRNMTDEGGMFYNLMEKQSASLTGRISNLGDAWDRMLNEMGQNSEGVLYGGISALNSMVDNYETVLDVLKAIVVTYGAYKGAVVLLHMAEKARNISGAISAWFSLAKGIKTAKDAQIAFNLATKMNPLGLAAAGVAALVAGIVLFTGKTEQASGVSAEFSRDLEDQTKILDANFKALKSTTSGTDARKLAIDQINSKYGPYLDNLLTEKSTLEDIEEAQKRATQELARSIAFKAQQADLETFREDIAKSENAFSQALKQLFALNDVPAEIGGQVAAELDKMMRDWSETNIKNRVGFGDAFAQVFKDAGAEIDLLGVKGNNAYKGLFQSMQTVIDARQDERKATEELSSAYDAYLKQLGLSDDSSKKKGTDTEDGEIEGFKLEDFKKQLDERKKAYDEYNDAVRAARDEDRAAVKGYYSELIKDGDTYKEYLEGLLRDSRNNVEATTAIYLAAAKANVDLIDDRPEPIKGKPRLSPVEAITPGPADTKALEAAVQRYEKIYSIIRDITKTSMNIELADNLIDSAYAAHDVARAVSEIDADLGGSLMKVADLIGGVGNVIGTLNDSNASGFQKVSGIISLAITAGGELAKIRQGWQNEEVNAQMALNKSLASQLDMEAEINSLRRERAKQELYQSAFLDPNFKKQYESALDVMGDSKKQMDEALGTLMQNAVFTAEGSADRRLFGTKTDDYSFGIGQILGDYMSDYAGEGWQDLLFGQMNVGLQNKSFKDILGSLLDPAGIFGGYADRKAEGNALGQLKDAFNDTFAAMGKTSADIAKMSSEEWADFFSLMDEMGYITDEGTKSMVQNAKAAAEEYAAAMEEMKGIIKDVAGDLGASLESTLVNAFKNGSDAAMDFKDVVNDVLQSLFMKEIITPYFQSYFDKLQSEMQSSMDGGDGSWMDDIMRFSENVGPAFGGAIDLMKDFDKAMQEAGFDGFSAGPADASLSGAIKGVSEETASILAGQMNAIRINQAESLRLMNESARYWAEIAANTSYNRYLEGIHADIKAMRSAGSDLKAKGF
ncbi:tape measure protein [Geofilum rhodophaeum]|uniref:tape measure protein n=1 Tax=Geofilum rhodophaeum TaxID=1965019 RepID=UPI000B520632|nr:tape measure protein [Geofilum rhodophaeum]